MEYISKSFGSIAGLVGSIFHADDTHLINYCRSEYRNDWFWAYSTYQREGRFPNALDRAQL